MPTRRKRKIRPVIENLYKKAPNFDLIDLKNLLRYGDRTKVTEPGSIYKEFNGMLNVRTLTGSIPLDADGCWDDVFEYCFGDPNGVGWERFGAGFFSPDGTNAAYEGAIYLPPGEYPIKRRPLDLTGKVVIGYGSMHGFNKTSIYIHSSASASFDSVAYVEGGTASKIIGIRFNANNKAENAFKADNANNLTSHFEDIYGVNSKHHAVVFNKCQGTVMHRIKGEVHSAGSGSGVVFSGCNASRATAIEAITTNNHWGIKVLGGSSYTIDGNSSSGGMYLKARVENALSGAIYFGGVVTPASLEDSWIESIAGYGVVVQDCRGVVINRNRITTVPGTDVNGDHRRAVKHIDSDVCAVIYNAIEADGSGTFENEKFESLSSNVEYVNNYNLFHDNSYTGITVVTGSS